MLKLVAEKFREGTLQTSWGFLGTNASICNESAVSSSSQTTLHNRFDNIFDSLYRRVP
jgi:hypothetical protein